MDLVLTLSVSLAAALVLGYLTKRLGLSPLVGYLLAGILVGPSTPGFVADREVAEQLANIGVVLLMFGVGLHFDLKELAAMRKSALPGAIVQSAVAAALGGCAAVYLGGVTTWVGAIVYGLALSVASTVVMTRVLADSDELHSAAGRLAVGWTIVEDLLTVVILVLLPAFAPGGPGQGSLLLSVGTALGKIGLLFLALFLVVRRAVPWLLRAVALTRSRELFTLTVLVVALGTALASSRLLGVSVALGAFLGGMVVGRTDFGLRAANEALPMRDAFAVLFFVSVGMLFDPRAFLETPWLIAATLGIVVIAKPLVSFLLARATGQQPRPALSVGLALGQIGEFSFILAGVGISLGVLSSRTASAMIAVAIISIALNPLLRRLFEPLHAAVRRSGAALPGAAVRVGDALPSTDVPEQDAHSRAVVVGYGPVGRTLTRLLEENGISCTIIEMNLQTVHRLRSQGIAAVYGDASHEDTLRHAGVQRAGSFILSASGLAALGEIIRVARELNPSIRIIARTAYLREGPALRTAGADLVFSGEGEVAMAMNEAVMRIMGATAKKIARERERLRGDLFEDPR
jgi:CPA2 family monovalent cation:H+ antiporter-2